MKKLLLVSTAIAGVAMLSSPASAALKMDLGGYFDFYGVYADSHPPAGTDLRKPGIRRDSDVFVNGESTLDNGLTIGAHTDIDVGNNNAEGTLNAGTNVVTLNEVYGYGSGGWGRVNLGESQGAAYLLQVAAPSADSNVDGLRTSIAALNPTAGTTDTRLATLLGETAASTTGNFNAFGAATSGQLDYAQDDFRQTDRITYLTPKFNGFQAGVSYAPNQGIASATGAQPASNAVVAVDTAEPFKNLWEAGARWDGHFSGADLSVGGGYSGSSLNSTSPTGVGGLPAGTALLTDGLKTWNLGANAGFAGFSLGGVYKESKVGEGVNVVAGTTDDITAVDKTYDVGLGYDNGPYHVGASYLHDRTNDPVAIGAGPASVAGERITDTRYTVGGGYTFGPGMTFRGAVAWGKFDGQSLTAAGPVANVVSPGATASNRYQQVTVGTDIQF